MKTSDLQTLTKTAAEFMGARNIWPNGLGFDFMGWSFKYDEATGEWQAVRPGFVVGSGGTCADARMNSIMLQRQARKVAA